MEEGLRILGEVKKQLDLPILTDVHEDTPMDEVADVVDVLQTPAFLCRQTNFILRTAATGLPVNIKKGQFLSPWEMQNVVDKARSTGNENIMVCERGFSFGYNNLVSDMRSLAVMRGTGAPVVFDATHSVQQPGGLGSASGGRREFIPVLARAAAAAGVAGFFMETHPDPEKALSDGPNAWPLDKMKQLLETLMSIDASVKQRGYLEADYGLGVPDSLETGIIMIKISEFVVGKFSTHAATRRLKQMSRLPMAARHAPAFPRARRPVRARRWNCVTATSLATSAKACRKPSPM